MEMLDKELALIKQYIKDFEKKDLAVSKVSVGWHLDHSLKVINAVYGALKDSDPSAYKWKFNGLRLFAFTVGSFPRGRAKSPKRVLPPEEIVRENIEKQLELAIQNSKSILELKENQYFSHPLFKQLNKKKTIKFLGLHTNHHLKIVRDILRAN